MPKITSFTAIDFETAQGPRWSICQVGLVKVENGKIVDEIDLLVQPPDNFYHYRNTEIHGIHSKLTVKEPTFDTIWPIIKPYINKQNVVAHNMAFDNSCLVQTLQYYNIKTPVFNSHCTYKIFGSKLSDLCKKHKILLDHHNALSDARACAQLFLIHNK
jgi:DNA polymerase III subunit epsilon